MRHIHLITPAQGKGFEGIPRCQQTVKMGSQHLPSILCGLDDLQYETSYFKRQVRINLS